MVIDDGDWADFTASLNSCLNLTTIAGLDILMCQFGRLNELKDALDQQWSKPEKKDLPKKLGFVVRDPTIDGEYGQGADGVQAFSRWAAEANCDLEWQPWDTLRVGCNSDTVSGGLPAPVGLYGEVARQLIAKTADVTLCVGGPRFHPSWRDELIFPRAEKLTIDADGASALDSIPEWLTEREGEGQTAASRHFPAVAHLEVFFGSFELSDLPSAPSKLSRLVAALTGLKRVTFYSYPSLAVACELLSYLSVPRLAKAYFARPPGAGLFNGPDTYEWPDDVLEEWPLRCPLIEHMATAPDESDGDLWRDKEGVESFLQLVSTLRPLRADLTGYIY